eukprot:CAMPEP_0119005998 /NCGR_PEP_ID=MMETSP1176-20130426/2057_1 /TAXON_ID=265551 /ORGANISM="Synedropsis recta cf, Strain CCMP1620" /LENGTH=152 /DNA_ID=CAMNT_0006957877 /DNA_START=299 /DNA_END=757 /DNA_ORIENTATION=-
MDQLLQQLGNDILDTVMITYRRQLVDDATVDGNNVTVDGRTDDMMADTDDNFERDRDDQGKDLKTAPPAGTSDGGALSEEEKIGFAVMSIVVAILVCLLYQCYGCYKRRQQRKLQEYANTRAESVLGDMVMVPTSFDDDDDDDDDVMAGELI